MRWERVKYEAAESGKNTWFVSIFLKTNDLELFSVKHILIFV